MKFILTATVLTLLGNVANAAPVDQAPAAPQQPPGQQVEETFGDWSRICTTDEGQTRVCQIVQSANQNESGQLVFQTAVGYVADNEQPIMYLTAPLGIFLPRGISIVIDEAEEPVVTATVQRCDANGCLAVVALEESLVNAFKKGRQGQLIFGANARQNVALPLSLTGFTGAFESLERPAAPTDG